MNTEKRINSEILIGLFVTSRMSSMGTPLVDALDCLMKAYPKGEAFNFFKKIHDN